MPGKRKASGKAWKLPGKEKLPVKIPWKAQKKSGKRKLPGKIPWKAQKTSGKWKLPGKALKALKIPWKE